MSVTSIHTYPTRQLPKFVPILRISDQIPSYLIETQPLYFSVPRDRFEEVVQLFARIPERTDILTQLDNHVGTYSLRVTDELEFVQTTPPCLVIAGDNDLLLLHGERQAF